jgi:tRNA (guanine-N7-)-methyltransferase
MPHITVKPFDTSLIEEKGEYRNCKVLFKSKDLENSDELIGVEIKGSKFLLYIKKSKTSWLLKYDKITRPIDVNLVKEAIYNISKELNLEIINSNIFIRENRREIASEYQKSIEEFYNVEFPYKRLSVEIGFGSGKHLLYQAVSNPNELFIGIEIHTPSAKQLLRQIKLKNIKNIWVVNYDARLLLEMIKSNSVSRIFLHFPVPWDKKPHRRVISTPFLNEAMRVLKKGGRLEVRTDSYNYFWYSLDIFLGAGVLRSNLEIRKNVSLEIISKYEARWRQQNKDIYDIFVNSLENSEKRDFNFDFTFTNTKYKKGLLNKISKQPILFDSFFIHFERFYRVGADGILIRVAFGSFNRAEHKYILIDRYAGRYFPQQPVRSFTNYKAHQKIEEYLNV